MTRLEKIVLVVGYGVIAWGVLAMPAFPLTMSRDPGNICNQVHDAALAVMAARQGGVPLDAVLDGAESDVAKAMVLDAYRRGVVAPEAVERVSEAFADIWGLRCLEEVKG